MSQSCIQAFMSLKSSSFINSSNSIIDLTKDIDPINALLEHKFTDSIKQDPNNFCFNVPMDNGYIKKTGGLFKRLQKNFYSKRFNAGQIQRKKGSSGKSIGVMVHRQIHHLVTCEKSGTCDCDKKTSKNRLNKYTKLLFEKLQDLNIEPIATEVPVYNQSGGFCTRLDMIARQDGCIPLIISLKTGHNVGFNKDSRNHYLEEPFEEVSATSQNINQLQALSEYQILKRDYGITFNRYLIIYLGKKGTQKSKKLESSIKNSKLKDTIQDDNIYIEEPARWCWNILPENINTFYNRLNS